MAVVVVVQWFWGTIQNTIHFAHAPQILKNTTALYIEHQTILIYIKKAENSRFLFQDVIV